MVPGVEELTERRYSDVHVTCAPSPPLYGSEEPAFSAPSPPPRVEGWGPLALTAQTEKGEEGMTWLLVCQLSPKVTFVFARQTWHHLPGTAVPGTAIPSSSGREGVAVS